MFMAVRQTSKTLSSTVITEDGPLMNIPVFQDNVLLNTDPLASPVNKLLLMLLTPAPFDIRIPLAFAGPPETAADAFL
jgi:hypothetical protein